MGLFSNYEYWPTRAFYWPCYVWGPLQALRAGHPCFYTALNPGWPGGGIGFESKYGILQDAPLAYRPAMIRIIPEIDGTGELNNLNTQYPNAVNGNQENIGPHSLTGSDIEGIITALDKQGISFPFVAKPDVGFRGLLVKIIQDKEQLIKYLASYPIPIILQSLVTLPTEVGVLYYRFPGESTGHITSVTTKRFLSVTGDGKSTLRQLILSSDRATRQLPRLEIEFGIQLDKSVPNCDEMVPLGKIGNHSKGTAFIDSNHLISPELVTVFDQLTSTMPGFTYGRFDLRCADIASLLKGDFQLLEINGALAEPTHLYDAGKNNYFSALKDIMYHWYIIGKLSGEQLRRGVKPLTPRQLLSRLYALKRYAKAVEAF